MVYVSSYIFTNIVLHKGTTALIFRYDFFRKLLGEIYVLTMDKNKFDVVKT